MTAKDNYINILKKYHTCVCVYVYDTKHYLIWWQKCKMWLQPIMASHSMVQYNIYKGQEQEVQKSVNWKTALHINDILSIATVVSAWTLKVEIDLFAT